MNLSELTAEIQRAISDFGYRLEVSSFPPSSSDLALQYTRLLRLIVKNVKDFSVDSAVAVVSAAAVALQASGPTYGALPTITAAVLDALRSQGSEGRTAALKQIELVLSRVGDARTALVDNIVSAIAGGPERRCVMILGARKGGAVEEAVCEAAVDMDQLDVVVIAGGAGSQPAEAMADRLRAANGVGDVRTVRTENLIDCLRELRVHGLLLDSVAVSGESFVADCGAGVAAAVARAVGIRVFACAADYDLLASDGLSTVSLKALREARAHPGIVMPYESIVRANIEVRILHPLWDFVDCSCVSVLVSSSGAFAAGSRQSSKGGLASASTEEVV